MAKRIGFKRWLRSYGFRPVLGMYEYVYGAPETIVKGVPFTWGTENGLTVVYDCKGNPWVWAGVWYKAAGVLLAHDLPRGVLPRRVKALRPGGYVPFSCDPSVFTNRSWGRHSSNRNYWRVQCQSEI